MSNSVRSATRGSNRRAGLATLNASKKYVTANKGVAEYKGAVLTEMLASEMPNAENKTQKVSTIIQLDIKRRNSIVIAFCLIFESEKFITFDQLSLPGNVLNVVGKKYEPGMAPGAVWSKLLGKRVEFITNEAGGITLTVGGGFIAKMASKITN